ncbi:sulfotransferase 1B1-like [Haliotis asinina]|uniref:sulfotransferase 1B1-like n=1 Tax=Haliotis asinina TaxID=109174 RepID=UPI0035325963
MSSKVELVDRSGHSFVVNCVDGYYFHRGSKPIPFHHHLDSVKEMAIRQDDVMICSYPKSGLHWLWEVVNMITHEDLNHRSHKESMNQPDFRASELDKVPSPRVLSSHIRFRFLPCQLITNKTKIILLERDPKSVAVSFYNMTVGMKGVEGYTGIVSVKEYNGSWEDFLQMFLEGKVPYGSWFDYKLEWEDIRKQHPDLPLMDLTFEDMKQNTTEPSKGARRVQIEGSRHEGRTLAQNATAASTVLNMIKTNAERSP